MPMPLACLIAAIALTITPALQAADHEHHAPASPVAKAPLTEGLIKKIDRKAGEVIIAHGRLDSIGMPPMTMGFGVAKKDWLDKLKEGDKIRFAAEIRNGQPIVSRYEAAP